MLTVPWIGHALAEEETRSSSTIEDLEDCAILLHPYIKVFKGKDTNFNLS